jgi:hypothetical protein
MPMSTSYLSSIQLNRAPVDVDPSTLKDVPIMTLHVSPILEQASIGKRSTILTRRGIRFRVKVMWCLGQGLPSSLLLDDLLLSLSLSILDAKHISYDNTDTNDSDDHLYVKSSSWNLEIIYILHVTSKGTQQVSKLEVPGPSL